MKSFLTDFVFFTVFIYIYIYYWITKCAVWATHPPTHPPTHHPPTLPLFRGWVRFSLTQNSSIQAQAPIYIYIFFFYTYFSPKCYAMGCRHNKKNTNVRSRHENCNVEHLRMRTGAMKKTRRTDPMHALKAWAMAHASVFIRNLAIQC